MASRAAAWIVAALLVVQGWAQPPEVDSLFPAGGQRGTAISVSAVGEPGAWPLRAWTDDPGLAFEAGESPGQFRVFIAATAVTGPHLVRFYNPEGCTPPRLFVVGEAPEINEPESAERGGAGEPISTLPVTVNGRFRQPGETDIYLIALGTDQILHADLAASGLDSPLAGRLRLLDPGGENVGESTNQPPRDPSLVSRVRVPGTYRLLISSSTNLSGEAARAPEGDLAIYRLTLAVTSSPPELVLSGGGLALGNPTLPGLPSQVIVRAGAEPDQRLHPETLSPTMSLPGVFTGFISPVGDEDRFSFLGQREEIYRFSLRAGSLDSPLLPVLRILDGGQQVLAESSMGPDVAIEWVAPGDGAYTIVVADAVGGGGSDFRYELDMQPPEPRLTAEASEHTLSLRPGASQTVTVELRRPATHRGPLPVSAVDLPLDVTAAGTVVTADGSQATLVLTASANAAPSNQPFRISLLDMSASPLRFVIAKAPLRGRHTVRGGLLLNETEALWVTVLPALR